MTTTIDFETEGIQKRPFYPPKPVGVAIKEMGRKGRYYAWGHPSGNNCSFAEGARAVREAMRDPNCVFHNSIFDMDVAEIHLGAKPAGTVHDTLYAAFLLEPDAVSLSLKNVAERWAQWPPEERDAVHAWLIANLPQFRLKRDQTPNKLGASISLAPGDVVGRYAIGDVDRTEMIYKIGMRDLRKTGMMEAYLREVALTPITLEMERTGIRCDVRKLKKDLPYFQTEFEDTKKRIYRRIGYTFNIASNEELFNALNDTDRLSEIIRTPKGNPSTAMKVLHETCTDKQLIVELGIHSVLETYLSTFIGRWIELAEAKDGYIHPSFNQVRDRADNGGGTRTGRYSSSDPNFQNVAGDVEGAKNEHVLQELARRLKRRGLEFIGLRDYILPDPGCAFVSADYSQQEPRILAHFEQGRLTRAYLDNPQMDVHDFVRQLIKDTVGTDYPRKFIKVVGLGLMYGMGVDKLASGIGQDRQVAQQVKNAYLLALPGIKELQKELKVLAMAKQPLVTWGGRRYFCEEPRMIDGQVRTFEYKMLNTLIQGSAADCTKQGMLNVRAACEHTRIALQVHDELLCCVPVGRVKHQVPLIKEALEAVKFRVPMVTDPSVGEKSWGRLK